MIHDELGSDALPALRALARKEPSDAARRRIIEGARARTTARAHRSFHRLFAGIALAGAATAAVALSIVSDPTGLTRSVFGTGNTPEPSVATLESVATGGRYAIGPHRVEIEDASRLRFQAIDPRAVRLELSSGQARFAVDKLAAGDTFEVRTSQVLVQVVGTRFNVSAEGECSEVSVEEGRVRVLSPSNEPSYLGAGEVLRFCAEPAPGPATLGFDRHAQGEGLVREALVLVSQGRDLDRAAHLLARYRNEHAEGPFTEEALFHLALVKARLGFLDEAQELAAHFEASFPTSPRTDKLHSLIAAPTER